MKKFVNDPQQVRPRDARGHRPGQPRHLNYVPEFNLIYPRGPPRRRTRSRWSRARAPATSRRTSWRSARACSTRACPGEVFAAPPVEYVLETHPSSCSPTPACCAGQQLPGRPDGLGHGHRDGRGRGHQGREVLIINDDVAVQGLDLDGRPPRRGRQLLRHQGRRRGRREGRGAWTSCWRSARRSTRNVRTMGMALTSVHAAGQGHAALRDRRRRDGGRHRHPRRAGPPARRSSCPPNAIVDEPARRHRARPAVQVRRRGRVDGQRPRRHADQRALPALRHRPPEARGPRASRLPQLRRRILHLARDGGRVAHPAQGRRRARRACCSRRRRSRTGCSSTGSPLRPSTRSGGRSRGRPPRVIAAGQRRRDPARCDTLALYAPPLWSPFRTKT